jgi:hypothetical protein
VGGQTSIDAGSVRLPLQASSVTIDSRGEISLGLSSIDPVDAQISAVDAVRLTHEGNLRFVSGSVLRSSTGEVNLEAAGDLWTSGLTLSAKSARIEAGQAIRAEAIEASKPLVIEGHVHFKAQSGIGGFGFERVLIEQQGDASGISASNGASGDVVIAGVRGLSLTPDSVQSESDGWVALLGGRGALVEQGDLIVRPNVVRATGINWMARESIDTTLMLTAALKSGVIQKQQEVSPLENINRLLAQEFSQPEKVAGDALDNEAQVISTQARSSLSAVASRQVNPQTVSVMAAPGNTSKLLEMAMAFTQKASNPAMGDAESLGNWVVRTSPAESVRDSSIESRTAPPPSQPPNQQIPQQPAEVRGNAQPDPSQGQAAPVPAGQAPGGTPANVAPDQTMQPAPGNTTESSSAPTSNLRWFVPEESLQAWLTGDPVRNEALAERSAMQAEVTHKFSTLRQWPSSQPSDSDPAAAANSVSEGSNESSG